MEYKDNSIYIDLRRLYLQSVVVSSYYPKPYGDYIDSISLTIRKKEMVFEITDGSWDRIYRVYPPHIEKFLKALGMYGKTEEEMKDILYKRFDKEGEAREKAEMLVTIKQSPLTESIQKDIDRHGLPDRPTTYYVQKFIEICEEVGVRYAYTSWRSYD